MLFARNGQTHTKLEQLEKRHQTIIHRDLGGKEVNLSDLERTNGLTADLAARLVQEEYGVTWDSNFPGYRRFHLADPHGNRVEILGAISGE